MLIIHAISKSLQTPLFERVLLEHYEQINLLRKDDFKKPSHTKGIVFVNERKKMAELEDDGTLEKSILDKVFKQSNADWKNG